MILTGLAQLIGLIVFGFVAPLAIVTVAVTIHDRIRAWFPDYDLRLYDDVSRWNRRKKRGP